jgi:hypothetical protein
MLAICPAGAGRSTHDIQWSARRIRNLPPILRFVESQQRGLNVMTIGIAHLQPVVALVAGILILVIPRLLNIIVAVYLILVGLLGLGLFR